MTTIISKRRGEWLLEAAAVGASRAPVASRHADTMNWWGKCGFADQADLKAMLTCAPRGYEWLSTVPESVAVAIYRTYPEVYDDTTGKTLIKFLSTEAGKQWLVPGNRIIKL